MNIHDESNRKNSRWLILIFLLLGITLTSVAYWQGTRLVDRELNTRLDTRTKAIRKNIEQQSKAYNEVLYGLQSIFMLHPKTTMREFQNAYRVLSLKERFPEMQVVGFSSRVPFSLRSSFDAEMKIYLENNNIGYPKEYLPSPVSKSDSYIVQYSEPIAQNHHAIGKDLGTEQIRRAAIERARDIGKMVATERVNLLTHPDEYGGIIFYMPIYEEEVVPTTIKERQERFSGIVFLGVRIDEMLHKVFGPEILKDVDIEIYSVKKLAGSEVKVFEKNVLFDSNKAYSKNGGKNKYELLSRSETLEIGERNWEIQITALPGFMHTTQRSLPYLAGLSAFLCTLVAFIFIRIVEKRKIDADNRANLAERSLQTKEAKLAHISSSIDDILWTIDIPSKRTLFTSAATERVYGRPAQDFYENPVLWIDCVHPDDRNLVQEKLNQIIQCYSGCFQYRILHPQSGVRWLQVKAYFIPGKDPGSGILDGITADITDHRQLQQALMRNNRALMAIHTCDQMIAHSKDEISMLQGVCNVMVANGYRMAWAGKKENRKENPIIPLVHAGEYQDYLESFKRGAFQSGLPTNTVIDEAMHTCQPVVSNRFSENPRFLPWRDEALKRGFLSRITLPLCRDGQALGILNVYADEEDAFDDEEVKLLQNLANNVAVAVQAHHHRLARQKAESALQLRQRAIEACANPIVITSAKTPDSLVEYVNSAFEKVTGYSTADIIGKQLILLCREDVDQPGLWDLKTAHKQAREGHAILRIYAKDGTLLWTDVYGSPVRNEEGVVTNYVYAMYDITTTKQYQSELEYQANYDKLTGLANRTLLQDRINQAIVRAASQHQKVWLATINLDRFKFVNASMGQGAGDTLLQQLAQRLQETLRPTDTLSRIAADEFVLLLPDAIDEDTVISIAQSVMKMVALPLKVKGQECFLTCSIGLTMYPEDGDSAELLIKNAGIALQRAKELGRNNFQFYTQLLNQRAMERLNLEGDLRLALSRNELVLHYQPQLDLHTHRMVGAEALLRWQHPVRGLVRPDQFIPIAEDTGLIVAIGAWALRSACLQNKAWQHAGFGPLRVGVNLSSNQFYQSDLVSSIEAILKECELRPDYLDIELTEGLVMHNVEQAVATMHELKALGVKLSIDDFGTGYSSLSYLRRFPIDVLKIDQSFVHNIATDSVQAAITCSIVQLARSLGLQVIAEGVETQEQLEFLKRQRCDEIQGYFFSRPLPAQELEKLLYLAK